MQLNQDEIIIKESKVHWWAYSGFILSILVSIILMIFYDSAVGWIILLFCAIPIGIIEAIRYSNNEFIITNQRIIANTGMFNTRSIEMLINKIEGLTIEQSLVGSF